MPRSVAALWFLVGLLLCLPVQGEQPARHDAVQAFIGIADLPSEARDALRLIQQGGPFPYARDGVVFSNYEKLLPPKPRGYYHEYTVKTPGTRNRGARRIVCGPITECYYTTDHYRTFQRIRE
jgi:ribonuclease T1